jgi:acylphosphatase
MPGTDASIAVAARRLGLTGLVRNEPDGSVAALFAGQETAVAAMLALCREGPPLARVHGGAVHSINKRHRTWHR